MGTVPETGIPEGLRDVVGKRLSRLSRELQPAARHRCGHRPRLRPPTLRGVANLAEEEPARSAIEEAVRVGVLEERSLPGAVALPLRSRLLPAALYEEMIAPGACACTRRWPAPSKRSTPTPRGARGRAGGALRPVDGPRRPGEGDRVRRNGGQAAR